MLRDTTAPALPLVDLEALTQLEQQLNDPGPARAFARDFITVFQDRYLRLAAAIGSRDQDAAMDAALSLSNSSKMVGAARLSILATGLEQAVGAGDLASAGRALPGIERCGLDTVRELEMGYLDEERTDRRQSFDDGAGDGARDGVSR